MREKTDARVVKTKAKLVSTFMDLISKSNFDEITVNHICELAGVRRATFYKHYTDKYDFFKYIVSNLRYDFDGYLLRGNMENKGVSFADYAVSLVDYFDEHEAMINNICKSTVSSAIFSIAISRNFEDTRAKLKMAKSETSEHSPSLDVLSTILVGGVFHTLLNWVQTGKKIPKDVLKLEIKNVINKINC
jgi:AcrR family transcriptional regulator